MAKDKLLSSSLEVGRCLFVSAAGLQGWICITFIWVSSPVLRASYQIVPQCLFPQLPSPRKTEASNWAGEKGCRLSPNALDCILGDVGHVCTVTPVLVTTHEGLHSDGVCFLSFISFFSMAHPCVYFSSVNG